MNSKQLAGISLAVYVAVLALAFSLVKFATRAEEVKKTDDLVYVALEMTPEPEEKKEKKIKEQPKQKTKKATQKKSSGVNKKKAEKKKDNASSNPNKQTDDAQEAKGQEEKIQTVDQKALLTSYFKGQSAPAVPQGNTGEESDKTAGTSNYHDGFDAYGVTVPGAEGGDPSRNLRGGALPQPEKSLIKQTGVLYLKLKVDKNGNVISVSVDNSQKGNTISNEVTRNAILRVVKEKAKFDPGESEMTVTVKYVCKQI